MNHIGEAWLNWETKFGVATKQIEEMFTKIEYHVSSYDDRSVHIRVYKGIAINGYHHLTNELVLDDVKVHPLEIVFLDKAAYLRGRIIVGDNNPVELVDGRWKKI